ncbi:unnamed protein product [Urochloa humidicola]
MRKEIIIRMQPDSDKGRRNKALKVAASVSGVESVTVAGSGKDLLLVIGDGLDDGELIRKLKKEVGDAEIVELRTLPPQGDAATRSSPYQRWPGDEQSRQAVSYYHHTPSPGYYQYQHYAPSPVAAAQGDYLYSYVGGSAGTIGGSLYAREVARSHPAHYSPMIARHDLRVAGRPPHRAEAGGEGREHGGGEPNCCSIL